MKWLYRITLLIAGCYFESAVRNAVQTVLYWMQKPELLQGFLPYMIPIFFGYVYAIEVRGHWSGSRLKNDIMAYMGSTVLIGYPFFVAATFWAAGIQVDANTALLRYIATGILAANLAIAILVWRRAVRDGYPVSLPWGTEVGAFDDDGANDDAAGGVVEAETAEAPKAEESFEKKPE